MTDADSVLVAICIECEVYMEASSAGFCCEGECETPRGTPRRLRKRRGYICACCENQFFFSSKAKLAEHQEEMYASTR